MKPDLNRAALLAYLETPEGCAEARTLLSEVEKSMLHWLDEYRAFLLHQDTAAHPLVESEIRSQILKAAQREFGTRKRMYVYRCGRQVCEEDYDPEKPCQLLTGR